MSRRSGEYAAHPSYQHRHSYSNPLNPLYHESPQDHDEPFDVRADFDGVGPRWSEIYGTGAKGQQERPMSMRDDNSYKRVDGHVAPSGYSGKAEPSREELVSVPVLGPEWQKSELHEMTRRGKSEARAEKRSTAWKLWKRDQSGLCGLRWLTRRLLIFALFFLCVGLGITLFFVIPRAPGFTFYETTPFTVDNSTVQFSRTPTNFSFHGNLNLYADTSSSYLPVHFKHLEATLLDATTNKVIATGDYGNKSVKKGKQMPVVLPVAFSYSALNTSDTTWNDMYSACGHIWTGTERPDLKFRLELRSSIVGLVNKQYSGVQLGDIACPFELPADGV